MRRAQRALVLLALATVIVEPSSAIGAPRSHATSFQPFFEYTISFVGSGSYARTVTSTGGGTLTVSASFNWKSVYPHVLVPTTSSNPLGNIGFPALGLGQEGSGKWKIVNTGSHGEDCSNEGMLGLMSVPGGGGGGGGVKVHRSGVGAGKGVVFNLQALSEFATPTGSGDGAQACDPASFWHDVVVSGSGVGTNHVAGATKDVQPLSATVKLAPSDLKHGVVTKKVSISASEQIPSECGSGGGNTCTQSYTWSGSVRFTKHKFK
jgi:hypothetical protein